MNTYLNNSRICTRCTFDCKWTRTTLITYHGTDLNNITCAIIAWKLIKMHELNINKCPACMFGVPVLATSRNLNHQMLINHRQSNLELQNQSWNTKKKDFIEYFKERLNHNWFLIMKIFSLMIIILNIMLINVISAQ